jgi:uncharacterized membrane protein (DUF485 family)
MNTPYSFDTHAARTSPTYAELKSRTRSITLRLLAAFVAIYGTYVGTSVYASGAVADAHVGPLSVAWLLALTATAMPVVIAVVFMRYSDRVLQPLADEVRALLVERDQ